MTHLTTSCTAINVSELVQFAQLCVAGTLGSVLLAFPDGVDRAVLLRVGGPHPQTVPFERSSKAPMVWEAPFRLCEAGAYTVHVRHYMDDPWKQEPVPRRGQRWTWPSCAITGRRAVLVEKHEWHYAGTGAPCLRGLWHYAGDASVTRNDALGVIRMAPSPWAACADPLDANLSSSCQAAALHMLQYAPPHRSLHGWGGPLANARLLGPNVSLCLAGDSHMRALVCKLAANASLPPTTATAKLGRCGSNCRLSSCPCQLPFAVHYDTMVFGEAPVHGRQIYNRFTHSPRARLEEAFHNLSRNLDRDARSERWLGENRCGAVLINIAHWPAAWQDGAPWMLGQYRERVGAMMQWAAQMQAKLRIPVGWLAHTPYPLNEGNIGRYGVGQTLAEQTNCPPKDWRFPHVLTAYHRLAISLAKAAGVDMLDRYEPTFQLQELATAEHYGEPAAHEAAHLILDWLKERGVVKNTATCPRSRGARGVTG